MNREQEIINITQTINWLRNHSAFSIRNHDMIAVLENRLLKLQQSIRPV